MRLYEWYQKHGIMETLATAYPNVVALLVGRSCKNMANAQPHYQALVLEVHLWRGKDNSIHLSCNDDRLVDDNGNYKGMNIAISRRRQPASFNYLDNALKSEGQ